jgi:hypothetical protein
MALAQVVKQYDGRAVTGTRHRLLLGSVKVFLTQLWSTPGCQVLNTTFIERLNGMFRSRLACLERRTRCAARRARSASATLPKPQKQTPMRVRVTSIRLIMRFTQNADSSLVMILEVFCRNDADQDHF